MGSQTSKNQEYSESSFKRKTDVQIQKVQVNFILPQEIKVKDPGDPVHSIDLGEFDYCDYSILQTEMLSKVSTQRTLYQKQKNHLKSILKKDDDKDKYSRMFNEEAKLVRFSVQKKIYPSHKKHNHKKKPQFNGSIVILK